MCNYIYTYSSICVSRLEATYVALGAKDVKLKVKDVALGRKATARVYSQVKRNNILLPKTDNAKDTGHWQKTFGKTFISLILQKLMIREAAERAREDKSPQGEVNLLFICVSIFVLSFTFTFNCFSLISAIFSFTFVLFLSTKFLIIFCSFLLA